MTEMLETFRDASATDLQAAGQAIARHEPQTFLRALHRLHGSAQILLRYNNCAPLLRLSDLIR
jgi:two-component system sensor histidine kinase EvgS